MAEEWTINVARELASSLITVGHPYLPAAIDATALDIYGLCTGTLGTKGYMLTPREQAVALVNAVRNWPEGWPERGGTRRLKDQFNEMFKPAEPEWKPASATDLVKQGRLAPPCEHCEADAEYCEFGGPRRHAREKVIQSEYDRAWAERQLAEQKRKLLPKTEPLSYNQMKAALDDEQRRRREQLDKEDQNS